MRIPRKNNPMSSEKTIWVWLLLFPIAFVLYIYFDVKEAMRVQDIKLRRKQEKFYWSCPEFDWWQDNQGL